MKRQFRLEQFRETPTPEKVRQVRQFFLLGHPNLVISIAGKPGAGKSTLVRELAKWLGLKHQEMSDPAYEEEENETHEVSYRHLPGSLNENKKLAKQYAVVDALIDAKGIEAAQKFAKDRGGIVAGRMPAFFGIPNVIARINARLKGRKTRNLSVERIRAEANVTEVTPIPIGVRIFLHCDPVVAGERNYFRELSHAGSKEHLESPEHATEKILDREADDQAHYLKQYGIDIADPSNYDIIIDTTNHNKNPHETLMDALFAIRAHLEKQAKQR
jgi:cytidylate kinase